ncbi:response regulator [Arenibaculum pallidiluteum]|uniref:response regulator n=1 Tax=Arenibaculum pallidiluteum TaxID=2812559 RepID=UPI001A95E573|nr:response regulator [Arenibaculum pallidiluteum]
MPSKRTARILIVEDESIVALDLGDIILALGHDLVGYATTAADAVLRTEQHRPDLVLMDIRLGLSDGVAAARQIRERFGTKIIFVSAFSSDLDRRGVADLGPVVAKPFSEHAIGRAIAGALAAAAA